MLPYWLMFTVWAAGAVQTERSGTQAPRLIFFVAAAVLTTLFIGLRFEVGGDWGSYQKMYDSIFFLSFVNALGTTDPGYGAINWFGAQIGLGVGFVNLVCAALFMGGVARLAWRQPNPALAVLIAVPYLIIVVAMGYTRQAAAIGIICFALADASERHLLRLIVLIGIAALLHKTAILILPIALVPFFRRNALLGTFGLGIFIALFALVLRESSDTLITNYAEGDYDSQGAAVRVGMNVLAAAIFLFFRKDVEMPNFAKSYWTTSACLALISVGAFFVISSSSGIDRISLYIIPLQIVIYSRLPQILSKDGRSLPSVIIIIISYSFLVQFIWLNYADNSYFWLPYKLHAM